MSNCITIPALRYRHRAEERKAIEAALQRNGGSLRATARELGVPLGSLQAMMRSHGIEASGKGRPGRPRKEKTPCTHS